MDVHGIGMTSRRTRDRLIQRLREEGIHDERVLDAIRRVPRHVFVDEALASRAYEDLRKLRGRVAFSVDWRELRKDRR